jgi:hypothetical protein
LRFRSLAIAGSCLVTLSLISCARETRYPEQCGAILPGWKKPSDGYGVLAITNKVRLRSDATLKWNGAPITHEQLASYSRQITKLNPRPFTILEVDRGTACADVQITRKIINDQVNCTEFPGFGLCGEGAGPWALIGDVPPFPKFYPSENEAGDAESNDAQQR